MNVSFSTKRLLSDSLYTFVSTAVSRVAFILISLISAKSLNNGDFQNLSILISTVNMLIASFGFAFGTTLLKKAVEYHLNEGSKISKTNFMSLVSVLILILSSLGILSLVMLPFIAKQLFLGDEFVSMFMIASALVGVGSTIASYLIVSLEKFRKLSKIKFISSIVLMSCCALVQYLEDISLRFDVILSFYFGHFVILLGWYLIAYRSYGWRIEIIKPERSHKNGIIDISGPAFLSNFTYAAIMWFQMMMIYQVTGDRELASKVAVALTWYNALVFVPQILSSVLLPKLLKAESSDFKLHMYKGGIINVISVAIAIVILLISSPYIDKIYSQQFNSISYLVLLMAFSAFPNALCKLTGQYFLVKEKMKMGFLFNLFWGGVYTSVTYMLMPYYQEYAVGLGLIVSYIILFVSQLIYFRVVER